MAVSSRQGLVDYALRSLGAPVLEINVDDDQLSDRVDEALEYWRLYHHEGIEKVYLKHQIKASEITTSGVTTSDFVEGETITGSSSGATAVVCIQTDKPYYDESLTKLLVRDIVGTFTAGETITGGDSNTTGTFQSIVLGEVDTKYIETTDWVYGVSRILPFNGAGQNNSRSMFDVQYQLRLNSLWDLTSTSIIYYDMVMKHLSLLDMELNGKPLFRFNRLQNRLHLDINWHDDITPGDYIVAECYRALNPADFTRVWGEPWLKHYTTALFKKQWATNLKKFQGIQLPGGVTLDGQGMYIEAMQEIKELEDQLMNGSAPLEFFMG